MGKALISIIILGILFFGLTVYAEIQTHKYTAECKLRGYDGYKYKDDLSIRFCYKFTNDGDIIWRRMNDSLG